MQRFANFYCLTHYQTIGGDNPLPDHFKIVLKVNRDESEILPPYFFTIGKSNGFL